MTINVLAFGIAKDIINTSSLQMNVKEGLTIRELRSKIEEDYPQFKQLRDYMVAVNSEYGGEALCINEKDEIALIPPVSGG
jgi:molybdopterin synthase sulfur carrier subunit